MICDLVSIPCGNFKHTPNLQESCSGIYSHAINVNPSTFLP